MAFRRRRKRKGIWLPVLGHNLSATGVLLENSLEILNQQVGPLHTDIFTEERPLTFDISPQVNWNPANVGTLPSLADFIGGGYSLRRIVGKCHVQHVTAGNQEQGSEAPAAVRVTAYFMVRRVDGTGGSIASASELAGNLADNIQDPYIWRQTWILGGTFDATRYPANQGQADVQDFPSNNVFDGGSRQQPFFDIQTRRTVLAEERLFFAVTTKAMPLDIDYDVQSRIYVHLDFRMFAFPLRVMGNRRNASR